VPDSALVGAISAAAAAASAIFAAVQIRIARRDANGRLVFEHLREVESRLQKAWACSTEVSREEVLQYFGGQRTVLTPGAAAYLSLLNSLDLVAYAVKKKLIDAKLISDWVKTVVNDQVLSLTFLRDLQECCHDEATYEHLYAYFQDLNAKKMGSRGSEKT